MVINFDSRDAWKPTLSAYAASLQPHHVEYLDAAGGFSGAQFWRLETSVGPLCLRCWPPEHPDAERLMLIHDVLRHAASREIDFLPVPIPTRSGRTFLRHAGTLWELAPWLPGEAYVWCAGRPEKMHAAAVALAHFHLATADFASRRCGIAPSPSVAARLADLRSWTPAELARLRAATRADASRLGDRSCASILAHFEQLAPRVERELAALLSLTTWRQPVIRDARAEHFLFTGDEVTGLVDFGGLNIDTPATDIARLVGSLTGDDEAAWQSCLAAYASVRPLATPERQLVAVFDRSGVALSGINWLRWLYLEGRQFADDAAVAARLAAIAARMRIAAGRL